jgi:hypothetical protein
MPGRADHGGERSACIGAECLGLISNSQYSSPGCGLPLPSGESQPLSPPQGLHASASHLAPVASVATKTSCNVARVRGEAWGRLPGDRQSAGAALPSGRRPTATSEATADCRSRRVAVSAQRIAFQGRICNRAVDTSEASASARTITPPTAATPVSRRSRDVSRDTVSTRPEPRLGPPAARS